MWFQSTTKTNLVSPRHIASPSTTIPDILALGSANEPPPLLRQPTSVLLQQLRQTKSYRIHLWGDAGFVAATAQAERNRKSVKEFLLCLEVTVLSKPPW